MKSSMGNKKILLLATDCDATNIIYNYLKNDFNITEVIIEEKESKKVFLKRRIKKLGYWTVIVQIFFQLIIAKLLIIFSKKRISEILNQFDLSTERIPEKKITHVTSINDSSTVELIQKINPDLIIVSGTRIISKKILSAVNCKIINIHAGITPKYRGVHGMYWALAGNDKENAGVTVHYVDKGVDTGEILANKIIEAEKHDNFSTYPYLQIAEGVILLKNVIYAEFENNVTTFIVEGESNLWYHPTFCQYLYNRLLKNIK